MVRYAVTELCAVLKVSRTGFYKWKKCKISQREHSDSALLSRIKAIFDEYKGIYGSPRLHAELRDQGIKCSRKRVARLMRENGLRAKAARKFKATTNSKHNYPVHPNLLEQNFVVDAPNKVWTADITYIWTGEGWLYLAIVLDVYSRKIVGWSMSERMTRHLVMSALAMAYWQRKPEPGLIHHSDRGSQYASYDYQDMLKDFGMVCSMSKSGDCYDNAITETVFHSLKMELIFDTYFATRAEAKSAIFTYIEELYNRKRKHSSLGYCSPVKFEQQYEMVA